MRFEMLFLQIFWCERVDILEKVGDERVEKSAKKRSKIAKQID